MAATCVVSIHPYYNPIIQLRHPHITEKLRLRGVNWPKVMEVAMRGLVL